MESYVNNYFESIIETKEILNDLQDSRGEVQNTLCDIDRIIDVINIDNLN